ncbi:MAG TPA: hypothetical protein VFU43_04770 [Streptosporangiaceae bacterium]|nr:hypothetical protein [Streptosporangiaceae bacterium]
MTTAKSAKQVVKLRAALRDREARVHELEERLAALENSTTMQFGRVFAAAARRPARGAVRLPRQLYRLWRRRDSPQTRPNGERRAYFDLAGLPRPEDRLLLAGPTDALTIAGVFGPGCQDTAAGCARVVSLLPHDAALALETADADLLIVDAAAGAAGGAWAYLGEPGVYDREQALGALMEMARDRGLPVVLWDETRSGEEPGAAPPGLARLDWTATGSPGVSLRRFNPVGVIPRDTVPVVVEPLGGSARVPPGVRRAAADIAAAIGARTVACDPRTLPDLLRRSAITLALAPSQVPEQLAAGALVLCPEPVTERLPADLREHVYTVAEGGAARPLSGGAEGTVPVAALAAAAGGHDPRPALRTLFLRYATPVRLAALCESLGLRADPLHERRVAVLAHVADAADARRLVAGLLAQILRPAEAIVTGPGAAVAAAELAERDIAAPGSATRARSAWVAPWPARGEVPATHLADLVCAAECSGADAVGGGGGEDAPYTFVTDIEPALVRRERYVSGGLPTEWATQGARLLAL